MVFEFFHPLPKEVRGIHFRIKMDKNAVLKNGHIKKINPKIIDNNPDFLFDSMFFFLQKFILTN